MHKDLVLGFFKNASRMLCPDGEIHVNHKTTGPFNNWNIENLASQCFLTLIGCPDFKKEDYAGYNNKRGDSARCDEPFPLGKCSTFKFVHNPKAITEHKKKEHVVPSRQQTNLRFQEIPTSVYLNHYAQTSHVAKMNVAPILLHLNHNPQLSLIFVILILS